MVALDDPPAQVVEYFLAHLGLLIERHHRREAPRRFGQQPVDQVPFDVVRVGQFPQEFGDEVGRAWFAAAASRCSQAAVCGSRVIVIVVITER